MSSCGSVYYVDCNSGNDGNPGNSFDAPYKTLAHAIAINNVDIARGSDRWARRNVIFLAADTTAENLVAFPNKCDVIGVGSYDANTKAGIYGQHAPVNAGNYGTRFINIWFKSLAVSSPLVSLASSSSGIQFVDSMFDGDLGTVTLAINNSLSTFMKVLNCKFQGGFATGNINLATGALVGCEISDNIMNGSSGYGILTNASTTVSYGGHILRNFIQAAGVCINDASSKFFVWDNTCITAAAGGSVGAGGIVAGAKMMLRNRLSGSSYANAEVPALGTLA
jgi:hypothetical protein